MDQTYSKAYSVMSILRRNTSNWLRNVKSSCHKTLARPIMEYSSTVWGLHTEWTMNILELVKDGGEICLLITMVERVVPQIYVP